MKKFIMLLTLIGVLNALIVPAGAELIDNGDGTITDTRTNLMWLKDANLSGTPMTWDDANTWANNLVFAGHSDWRLPSGENPDGTVCNSRPAGYNCTQTEFWSLWAWYQINYLSQDPFENMGGRNHWTSTEWPADTSNAMAQDLIDWGQNDFPKTNLFYAWAVRNATVKPKLCFPPHRGVPYDTDPPEIDGRVQEDVGWRGACRLTYGDGTDTAHMAFQGLKDNSGPYLYLSFEVRNDPTFDADDVVVINFRPSTGGSASDDRRIFIYPLCDDIGAGGPDCTLDTPDDKIDRLPRLVQVWRNSATWFPLASGQPTNLDVKVRSYTDDSSKAWNVEVKVPTSVAVGGGEWIDFSDEFLFYFNVIRVSSLNGAASEFRWPRNAPEVGAALDNYPFLPAEWGEGTKSSTARCKGVWLEWSDVGTYNSPSSSIKFTTPPPNTFTNTFFCTVSNDTEIGGVPQTAEDARVLFRIANWGIPGPGDWVEIPADNPGCPDPSLLSNPTCPQNIPPAVSQTPGAQTFNLKWMVPDADIPEYQAHLHQCILAELDSGSNTNIITKSVYRNMDFVSASEFSRSAQISTKGYGPAPEGMSNHQFDLHVTTREKSRTASEKREYREGDETTESLLSWAAHGYRYSGRFIIINRQRYSLVDPVGSFGYTVKHEGDPVKEWQHKLDGAEKVATDLYRLSIPVESAVLVTTQITPQSYGRWSAGIHSGVAIPTGSFANDFDPGLNVLLNVDYRLSTEWSIVGLLGYNDFNSNTTGIDDKYWINLSANIRYHQPPRGPLSYYIGAGPGVYIPEAGSTEFGANIGFGFDYKYNSSTTIEIGIDYHKIFDGDSEFLHPYAGIIFRF